MNYKIVNGENGKKKMKKALSKDENFQC